MEQLVPAGHSEGGVKMVAFPFVTPSLGHPTAPGSPPPVALKTTLLPQTETPRAETLEAEMWALKTEMLLRASDTSSISQPGSLTCQGRAAPDLCSCCCFFHIPERIMLFFTRGRISASRVTRQRQRKKYFIPVCVWGASGEFSFREALVKHTVPA